MLVSYLTYQHSVVTLATILKQNWEDFPYSCDDRVLSLAVSHQLLNQFIEPNWIDKQGTVHSVYSLIRDASISQSQSINSIARDWILMFWLQNNSWDVKVLCICKSLVNPSFHDFGIHPCCLSSQRLLLLLRRWIKVYLISWSRVCWAWPVQALGILLTQVHHGSALQWWI